jgi:RimJ/RimL family protein N-acetyltransferase
VIYKRGLAVDLTAMDIKTERLTLTPLGLRFLDSTHEYASNPEITKYMIHLPNETLEETEQFLQNVENEWDNPQQRRFETSDNPDYEIFYLENAKCEFHTLIGGLQRTIEF